MTIFRTYAGEQISNYVEEIIKKLQNNSDLLIRIGTDSRQTRYTMFATVICFQYVGKGVHIIYKKQKHENIFSIKERMLKETEYTVETLIPLMNVPDKKRIIADIDINTNKKYKSNVAYNDSVGWIVGLGFQVHAKPNAWGSSVAADYLLR